MAVPKVSDADLRAYLDAGHTQADAARHFGISEPAVHQRLKRMRKLTSRVVALEKAGELVEEKLTASARLERVQQIISDELEWAVQQTRQDGADRRALSDVIVKLAAEVRQQLGLQLAISRALVDLRLLNDLHEAVLGAIAGEALDTRHRILGRLKEQRVLRPNADLPLLTGGSHWRDPLHELIEGLERTLPPKRCDTSDWDSGGGSLAALQQAVAEVLYGKTDDVIDVPYERAQVLESTEPCTYVGATEGSDDVACSGVVSSTCLR